MAQSHLVPRESFEGEVSKPSSFQRELEKQIERRRRVPARGALRVLEANSSDLEMEQRVDALKEEFDKLPMEERRALMIDLREKDPALHKAVIVRITGKGKKVQESLARVEQIGVAAQEVEREISGAMEAVSERANETLGGLLKKGA